jgi:uncharacterized protein YhfF
MTESTTPRDLRHLPLAEFAFPGPLRDELVALILAGTKVATAGLLAEYIVDGITLPRPGDLAVVIDSERRPVAIIETTRCDISTISRVTDEFARDEGEGFADATDWRVAHERFWSGYLDDIRRDLGDPEFRLQDSTPVVCEWFRLVERFDPDSEPPLIAAS